MPKEPHGKELATIPLEVIERKIYLIRGHKVMLASDLAELYEVETKALNRAVKRNQDRFPEDFVLQLTAEEAESLRFHSGTSNPAPTRGVRRYLPYAFTEHGVAMLSSVLHSKHAVQMNILIVRAFVKLREILSTHKDLARAVEDIRRKQEEHGEQITAIIDTINQLLLPEPVPESAVLDFTQAKNPKPSSAESWNWVLKNFR
jgi:phage regulator Rha-like protein